MVCLLRKEFTFDEGLLDLKDMKKCLSRVNMN